jgi:lactate permease
MSRVMDGSGQTIVLASGTVGVLGIFYGFIAPFTGILGSFMTSSNMSSNILFGNFQLTTANLLHFNPAVILAAQTAGGAIGTSISPGNIILGTTTAGIMGDEGEVLKKIFPVAAALAFVFGIILVIIKLTLMISAVSRMVELTYYI